MTELIKNDAPINEATASISELITRMHPGPPGLCSIPVIAAGTMRGLRGSSTSISSPP
ncbi:MAG: hypothetical protein ACJ72M_04145 [Propionibacteriaceae bacterium]